MCGMSVRPRWRALAYPLLLVLVGVAAWRGSIAVPFVLDDRFQIVRSPAVMPPLSLTALLATPRPLVTASLALNHALGVLSAALSDFPAPRRVSLVSSFSEREGTNQCEAAHEDCRSVPQS
jgi:hypothetical protein